MAIETLAGLMGKATDCVNVDCTVARVSCTVPTDDWDDNDDVVELVPAGVVLAAIRDSCIACPTAAALCSAAAAAPKVVCGFVSGVGDVVVVLFII